VEGKIPIYVNASVVQTTVEGESVRLRVHREGAEECELIADHVIAATGYEVDVDRLPFVDPELGARIHRLDRAPRLSRHFETSVRGLYFIGLAAAASFGPLVRFVAGSRFAVSTVAAHLATQPALSRVPANVQAEHVKVRHAGQ
jgi:thioredoxin reductase